MSHTLWETNAWDSAPDEQILSALFDAPPHPSPEGMGWIKRHKPHLIAQYQNLFYMGSVPQSVKRIRKRAIGR